MRALNRKLLRDLWQIRGQALAIGLVIATGVAMFSMYLSTFQSLDLTQKAYYERYRFADVFANLKRAPQRLAERIAEIPGVARAETRVVVSVTLDVEGLDEPAIGRLVSIPETDEATLNDVYLRKGRYLEPGRSDQVLVHEAFALAHDLQPGDKVTAVLNGRRRELEIVGIALSPEFVYVIRPGDLLPDTRLFGIFWMGRRALATAFDMEGGFNDVTIQLSPGELSPGASEQPVIDRLDRLLAPYGGLGAVPRALQTSHWFVANELMQLETMASILPMIFLGVAAFLLNIVLSRIIAVQRTQIAALKAVGYSNLAVAAHYFGLGQLVALGGAVLGIGVGAWLGSGMTEIYSDYFRFPVFVYQMSPRIALAGIAVSLVAAGLGALGAVRSALALPPAEAMRPEPPARFKPTLLERMGLGRVLSEPGRMVLRNVSRRPVRFAISAFGVGMAMALMVLGSFFIGAIDVIMELQFEIIQRHQITVSFVEPTSARAFHEVSRLPGVLYAEPFRSVPVRLVHGQRSRQTAIQGLKARPVLQRVVELDADVVDLPQQGLVLSEQLGKLLDVVPGDTLTAEVLEGRRPVRQVRVSALVDDVMGLSSYMEIDSLRRLMGEGRTLSGAFLAVDPAVEDSLYRRLKNVPGIAGVSLTKAALQSFRDSLRENMMRIILFNVGFSVIIAFGVVYNAARISLSERSRDLASLRVLGFTRREISMILLGELGLVTVAALPMGVLGGYGLAVVTLKALETELFRMPLIIEPSVYAWASIVIIVASVLSGLVVRRRLDHLDLVAVLKTRE